MSAVICTVTSCTPLCCSQHEIGNVQAIVTAVSSMLQYVLSVRKCGHVAGMVLRWCLTAVNANLSPFSWLYQGLKC